jgi:NADPH:quinone reductase-like Zn-dependent oxidoreductase
MKAAVVHQMNQSPIYGDFVNPVPKSDQYLVRVLASSISQITKARASASHYSSDMEVPFVPGFDGVGTLEDGSRVYFLVPENPYGAMGEYSLVKQSHCIAIPTTISADRVAAMAIPGMSSWAALMSQAKMVAGETVLINGANGISGRLAIQIAKYFGAKKVIATARRQDVFEDLYALGAHECIQLTDDTINLAETFNNVFKERVDIILDYLWGPTALQMIQSAAKFSPQGVPIRFVQIGSIGGASISLPAAALRSSGLQLIGSGLGSLSIAQMLNAISELIIEAPKMNLQFNSQQFPLRQVTEVWNTTNSDVRTVLIS